MGVEEHGAAVGGYRHAARPVSRREAGVLHQRLYVYGFSYR